MSYAKPTVASRNRSRTPLGTSAAADSGNFSTNLFPDDASARRAALSTTAPRSLQRSRVDSGPHADAKRARKEPRTVHAPDPVNDERVRLSRELTTQCEAVVDRAHALLERAEQQGERMQAVLRASLERTPRGSLTPPPLSSAAATPSPRAWRSPAVLGGRRSQTLPVAPPPTPARPDLVAEAPRTEGPGAEAPRTEGPGAEAPGTGTGTGTGTGGWLQRVFGRSPGGRGGGGASPVGNGSDAPSPPPGLSPRPSRKSVAFKAPGDLEALTPPYAQEETRASAVYPPAPPPSAAKRARRNSRSRSRSAEAEEAEEVVERRLSSGRGDVEERIEEDGADGADGAMEEAAEDEDIEIDVAGIIREYPINRAYRMLTKASLVEFAKEHHIVLSLKSTKKELFDVARRLAISDATSQ